MKRIMAAMVMGVLGLSAVGRADPPADLPYAPKSAKVWTTADPHGFAALKWVINGILGRPTYDYVTNLVGSTLGGSGAVWRAEGTSELGSSGTVWRAEWKAAVQATTPFVVASMTEAEQFWRTVSEPVLKLPDGWIDAGVEDSIVDASGTTGLVYCGRFGMVNYTNAIGSCAAFDGLGTHSIDIPYTDTLLDLTNEECTVSFWLRVPAAHIGLTYGCPLASSASRENAGDTGGVIFGDWGPGLMPMLHGLDGNQAMYYLNGGTTQGGAEMWGLDGGETWHHCAYVFCRATFSLDYYFDGRRIGLASVNSTRDRARNPSVSVIQKWIIGRTDDLANVMGGEVDDVAMWRRALTAKDIQNLYGGGRGRPYDAQDPLWTGVMGHWAMNEGAGLTVADTLGLHGGTWTLETANWATSPVGLRGDGTNWTYRSAPYYTAFGVSNVVACYWLQSTNALSGLTNWVSVDNGATWTQATGGSSGNPFARRYWAAATSATAGTSLVLRVTYPGTEPCELRGVSLRGK
jgi:hypothetical protein